MESYAKSVFFFFFYLLLLVFVVMSRYRNQDDDLLPNADTLTLSPNRIKCHHPKCPKLNQSPPHCSLKSPMHAHPSHDTASLSGSIAVPNCNNSQMSSPEMSDSNESRKYVSSLNINNVDERDEKQKTILLKIPSVMKSDQLLVCIRSLFSSFIRCKFCVGVLYRLGIRHNETLIWSQIWLQFSWLLYKINISYI